MVELFLKTVGYTMVELFLKTVGYTMVELFLMFHLQFVSNYL